MSTLHDIRLTTSTLNVTQPDRFTQILRSVPVAQVLAVVSDRTQYHSLVQMLFSVLKSIYSLSSFISSLRVGNGSGPSTGRVQIFSLLSWLGQVGSMCMGLCGSPWIIQNVTLSVIVKITQFSELLVLLKSYFRYKLNIHE